MEAELKQIINFSHGGAVCERAVIADRPLRRMKGLLGRRSIDHGEGLLLRPAPSIHTAFMRFAIDAVFLDPELRVVGVVETMRPWRIAAKRHARSVLELAAGEVARRGVAVGDRFVVLDFDAASLNGDDSANGHRDSLGDVMTEDFLRNLDIEPAVDRFGRDGTQPPPLRVLLIARDRRFRTVASALLARRGCAISTSLSTERVAELVARERADVVVIDAGAMLTAAARTVATVAALEPPVGVVLVADEAESSLRHLPVLAKWGPFDAFYDAIEQAGRRRGERGRIVG